MTSDNSYILILYKYPGFLYNLDMLNIIIGADTETIESYKNEKSIFVEKNLHTYNELKKIQNDNITLLNRFITNISKVETIEDYRVLAQTLERFLYVQRINEKFNLILNTKHTQDIIPQLNEFKDQINDIILLK